MYKKIMVPLDGSKLAECVLPHVEAIAKACESPEVLLVRAVEPVAIPYGREINEIGSIEQFKKFEVHHQVEAEKYLSDIVSKLEKDGIKARADVITGKAAEALTEFAARNKADLLIIATHGRSGVSRWVWGSVAERLLRSIGVPVLMVRAPGCVPGI